MVRLPCYSSSLSNFEKCTQQLEQTWINMEKIVNIHIEKLPEGFYLATSDSIQGLVAQGRTIAETIEIAKDLAKKLIEAQEGQIVNLPTFSESFEYPLVVGVWSMGRLAGLRYRDVIKRLKLFGFEFYRQAAGSHEIWHNPATNRYTTIPNHTGDMPERTLRAILKQADIDANEFINKR